MKKKLYRSSTDRMFAGICGGLGDYFDIDSVVVRVLWLLVVIFTGVFLGLIAYILMIFIIPEESKARAKESKDEIVEVVEEKEEKEETVD